MKLLDKMRELILIKVSVRKQFYLVVWSVKKYRKHKSKSFKS